MNSAVVVIIFAFCLIIFITCSIIGIYNKILNAKNKTLNHFIEIDKEIKNKIELIDTLLEKTDKYDKYQKIVNIDYSYLDINDKINLNKKLDTLLKNVKANSKIDSCNNKIEYAKEFYNDSASKYNEILETIPNNLIASIFKFNKYDLIK